MLVTVEEDRAIKVEGHPDHPFTKGTLCGKVNDYLDRVYSPDRVLYISDMTRPGLVVAPLGYWRKLSHAGNTINAATSGTFADMGHAAAVGDSLVEVAAVG
jgi:anaerobic selenocysteine-containing dehydrogenase